MINKSVYLALGINSEGHKELMGIWFAETEGAKFWLSVLTELQNRGLKDIFIACVDGFKGFPEAIKMVYPEAKVQLCIVHMVRNSLRYVVHKDMKQVAIGLKSIYNSPTLAEAEKALDDFSERWDEKYPAIKSACKIIYLAIMSASKRWTMPLRNWKPAMNRFVIEFEGRFPV